MVTLLGWTVVPPGDIISPDLFNFVVDCVVQEWLFQLDEQVLNLLALSFYADDGRLSGTVPEYVQQGLTLLADLFARVGLHMSAKKTKAMISFWSSASGRVLSTAAHKRQYDRLQPTYRERKRAKVVCSICQKSVSSRWLSKHQQTVHQVSVDWKNSLSPSVPEQDLQMVAYEVPGRFSLSPVGCPVPGCSASGFDIPSRLFRHFAFRHPSATLILPAYGPLVCCRFCGIHSQSAYISRHVNNTLCQRLAAMRKARSVFSG